MGVNEIPVQVDRLSEKTNGDQFSEVASVKGTKFYKRLLIEAMRHQLRTFMVESRIKPIDNWIREFFLFPQYPERKPTHLHWETYKFTLRK